MTPAEIVEELNRKIYGDSYKNREPQPPNYFDICQKMNTNNMEANLEAVSEYKDILLNIAGGAVKEHKENKNKKRS